MASGLWLAHAVLLYVMGCEWLWNGTGDRAGFSDAGSGAARTGSVTEGQERRLLALAEDTSIPGVAVRLMTALCNVEYELSGSWQKILPAALAVPVASWQVDYRFYRTVSI